MGIYNKKTMIEDMRRMRIQVGLTQQEMADILGMSRETLNALENLRPSAVDKLTMDVVRKWWIVMINKPGVQQETRNSFREGVRKYLKI